VLRQSGVGATVEVDALPRSADLAAQPLDLRRLCGLAGGDDYELLFTAPSHRAADVARAARETGVPVTCIGRIEAAPGLRLVDAAGAPVTAGFASFDHFKTS
jgi:thiamine-monophosphate kinase